MVRRIAWASAIAGSVILAALTAALFSSGSHIRIPAITGLVTFCAIVLSYLGGIESGLALRGDTGSEATRAAALVLGIVPSLAAWGVLWLPSPHWQVGASLALFVAVWAAELWLARHGLVPAWFVDMRTAVTAAAVAILALAWWLL
ncbi:MAG TPA: DUF3429 domain-containing protein [Usitatibacter sp.]|jgi:hypothetical protein